MSYRNEYRNRSLRLPISMVRGNESEAEKIGTLASVLEDEQAAVIRSVSLEVSDFFTNEEIAWYLEQSGLQGKNRIEALRKALGEFCEAARAARQMFESANYLSAGLPNRIPGRVAHG